MITKFRIGAAGVALISAMGMATSANAATANATATAVILAPLTLTNNDSLDFGTIAVNGAGTATVTNGAVVCTANLVCSGGSPAGFTVQGQAGSNIAVSYANITTLSNGSGGTMVLSNMTNTIGAPTLTLTGGADTFNVGGQLAVGANQAQGTYNGTFDVIALYQ